jgi:uncharacterized membrane protein YkvA (DUF1232 family)
MSPIRIRRRLAEKKRARETARSLVREIPNLFKLVFRLVRDPGVPGVDKLLLAGIAAYMITPADLVPDFLGVFGWVDDIYLLGLALGRLLTGAGPDRLLRHWDGDPAALGYLVDGVEEMGGLLPPALRRTLARMSRPRRRRRGRRPQRVRIDEKAQVHIEE